MDEQELELLRLEIENLQLRVQVEILQAQLAKTQPRLPTWPTYPDPRPFEIRWFC